MRMRQKLRRFKRLAYVGLATGTVIAVRRRWSSRRPELGPPSSWPPLEASAESPVAAVGDLVEEIDADGGPVEAPEALAEAEAAAAPAVEPAGEGGQR